MKLCVSEIQDGNVVIGKARIISTSARAPETSKEDQILILIHITETAEP